MTDETKVTEKNNDTIGKEINLDELDNVVGGSIGNVRYTKTTVSKGILFLNTILCGRSVSFRTLLIICNIYDIIKYGKKRACTD